MTLFEISIIITLNSNYMDDGLSIYIHLWNIQYVEKNTPYFCQIHTVTNWEFISFDGFFRNISKITIDRRRTAPLAL